MKLKFKLIFPALVSYTDKLKEGFAGSARAFFIKIRPEYKEDRGLLEHELVHVMQFWCTLGMHGLMYKFSPKYRLWAELVCYRKQLKYSPEEKKARHADIYAGFIATKYGLDISPLKAKQLLLKK